MKDAKASVSRDPRALLAGAAPAAGTQPSDKLAIGDVIALTLTDLNGEETGSSRHLLKIDKDGRIALPRLSAPVQAAGLSDSELEAEINKAYARSNLIRDAKASVSRHALDAEAGAPAGTQPSDKLAVGDNITVGIMELNTADQDNTKTYNIGRDGQISLPYIGRVQAAGLSPGDLEKEIAKAYVDGFFFRDPHVNVNQLVPPIPPSGVPAPAGLSASSVTFSASPATVPKGDLHPIAIIISKGGAISVDGSATTWGALRAKIEAMSKTDRATTYLALKAESGDLPVSDFFEQQAEAQKVVDDLGLAYVSVAGIQQKSDAPPPGGL
jgi:protein involved in polysaccharide export with SLBB domain